MKYFVLLVILISTGAQAQDNANERIEALLEATNIPQKVEVIYSNLVQAINLAVDLAVDKPEKQAELKNFMKGLFQEIQSEINWENMKEPMIDIYKSRYSEKEISDMLAFNQSESGRSILAKQQAVSAELTSWSVQNAASFTESLESAKSELEAEIQRKRAEQ